ncbi:MAG: hypothetical protein Q8867_04150 [Bacteroidota bacterium]|nr:hypothetical protein [Bacteroidota bacterium]
MKRLTIIFIAGILSLTAFSQNATDALRYSRILYGGTARFQGMAGAMSAVGGDFSVIATNPAGLGLFKSMEMTISPEFWVGNTNSTFNGTTGTDNKVNCNLGNFGVVFSMQPAKVKTGGFQNFNFAIGVNRQNDFNTRYFIKGQNNSSSLLSMYSGFLNGISGITPSEINDNYPFDAALAYNSGLIYYDSTAHRYTNDAANGGVLQEKAVTTSGSINEFDMAFSANYDDILYFGATIGIPSVSYYETSTYRETRTDESIPYFRSMKYNQTLETHGTGLNLKVGVLYRPAGWIRIGAAIHTPTYFGNMHDRWNSDMTAHFDSSSWDNTQYSPDGDYDYEMTTPFRAIGSLAFIIGKYGLISGEYEYVNYKSARFHDDNDDGYFHDVNQEIRDSYVSPLNVRVGTEWRIGNFRVRGGFGYYGSPYKNGGSLGEQTVISGGAGYRGQHFYIDAAYVWSGLKDNYYLYNYTGMNPATLNSYTHSAVVTLGIRF